MHMRVGESRRKGQPGGIDVRGKRLFGQGFGSMSEPTKQLMRLVLSGELAHGGHPVLRWCMDNVVVRTDPAGNIKMDKSRAVERIDGAVALVMALDRALRCGGTSTTSIYEDRGLLYL